MEMFFIYLSEITNYSTPGAHFGIDLVNIEKERGKKKYAITILKGLPIDRCRRVSS